MDKDIKPAVIDDFKLKGGGPNSSVDPMAQKALEYQETNRLVLKDVGQIMDPHEWTLLMRSVNNHIYRSSGAGSWDNQYQLLFTGHDKFGYNPIPPNTQLTGHVFITRPKLNLTGSNVRTHRVLAALDTVSPCLNLALRALLDTKFASAPGTRDIVKSSGLININNPFIVPLCNCIKGISGFPDINIDTYTSEGGFYNEDQTTVLGYDNLNRTYDLSVEITDMQGGSMMALFMYWMLWMAEVVRGGVVAYAEDVDMRRLSYTCSIYRFLVDPSKQVIVGAAKATGCFPKSVPIGAPFNMNSGELHVSSAAKFSIPFVANKIEYNDPAIITDFNTLVSNFYRDITNNNLVVAPNNDPKYNFVGLPYISNDPSGINRLLFKYEPGEFKESIYDDIARAKANMNLNAQEPVPDPYSTSSTGDIQTWV